MGDFANINWKSIFSASVPWAELILRGSLMYWFLFLIFRFVIRRDVGSVGIADILLLVLVADASQNAMAGGYKSLTDGMVLIITLVGWNVLLDWLSFRYVWFRRFAQPPPLCLFKDGKMIKQNMRKEFITEDELWMALREEGIDSLADVDRVYLESHGVFSVIRKS